MRSLNGHTSSNLSCSPTWLSPFGNVCTLMPPYPWLGYRCPLHYPRTPAMSEYYKTLGTSLTRAALCPHTHRAASSTLPALIQAFGGRHERTCKGVAETIISRLWLTAESPFGHSGLPFRLPSAEGLATGSRRKGRQPLYLPHSPHRKQKATHRSRSPQKC